MTGPVAPPSGPLSAAMVLGHPLTTPFALGVDAALLAGIASPLFAGVRTVEGSEPRSPWRSVSLVAGAVVVYVATGSGLGWYQQRPSVVVIQHVLLMMAAPPLLVAGRPFYRVSPSVRSRGRSLRRVADVVSWPLYYGSMAAYFLTPLLSDSARHPWLLDVTQAWFVAVGLLFFSALFGAGARVRRSFGYRIAAILAGMPLETATSLALVLWPRPVILGTPLSATHAAGMVLWVGSMCTSGPALGAVLLQWSADDSRRTTEWEALVDAAAPQLTSPPVADQPCP